MPYQKTHIIVSAFFLLALGCNILFWLYAHDKQALWSNVPPAPAKNASAFMALGDSQMAYRMTGIMLQNLGNTGGDARSFKDYDYDRLEKWFYLSDHLDPVSDFVPLLAAYYFGATDVKEDLDPVIEYLTTVGQHSYDQKWRWLAQAVFLARFRQEDLPKALEASWILSSLDRPNMPIWAKQMPAFVMTEQGDKAAAYELMMGILKNEAENLHPTEVRFMVDYICDRLLDKQEAQKLLLCISER